MKFEETAVDIEKAVEKFQETKAIYRFNLVCMYYHVNLSKKMIVYVVNLICTITVFYYLVLIKKLYLKRLLIFSIGTG